MSIQCHNCDEYGHNRLKCPELIGPKMASTSKHVRYQLRKNIQGLCRRCPERLSPRSKCYCQKHLEITNKQKAVATRRYRAAKYQKGNP